MIRTLPFLFLILFGVPAWAADYFVCDTAENTGSDSNDGSLANPWLTMDKALAEIDALSGGDTLSFCEGFSGSSTSENIIASTGSCDNANFCMIDSYTPAGQDPSDDGVQPTLTNTTYDVLKLLGGTLEDGGYLFNNLHLIGGASTDCVDISGGFSNVTLHDITYDSCAIGTDIEVVAGQVSVGVDVVGATYTNVADYGYRGSSTRGSLIDLTLNGASILLQGIETSDMTLRDVVATGSACDATVIQGQGSFKGLYLVDDHITQTKGTADPACYGIAFDQDFGAVAANFNYVMFARTTVAWTGTYGIYCPNCTNVYLDHNIVVGDATITAGIDVSGASAKYVSSYKNYVVMIGADTGRTAINITAPKASFTKNQLFVNDADDVCINAAGTATYDDNRCHEAIVGGLLDRGIE